MADVDDDRLLDALAVALRPSASEPSMAELAALQSVVEGVRRRGGVGSRPRGRRTRRWVAGLLVGGVVLSGGTAYATNPVAPRPVRSAAFALKLPVEAPDLTDAKDALADLEEELREGRRDKVAAEVEDVLEELADLSPTARRSLEPRASTLLAAAAAYLADTATSPSDDDDADSRAGSDSEDDSSGTGSDVDSDDDSSSSGSGSSGSHDGDDGDGAGDAGRTGSGPDDDVIDSDSGSGGSESDADGGSETDSDDPSGTDSGSDDSSGSGSGSSGSGRSGSDDGDGGVSASSGADRSALDDGAAA